MALPRLAMLTVAALVPPAVVASDVGGIAGSDLAFLAYVAGGVVGVVAVVAWVDHRVDKRVKAHQDVEERLGDEREARLMTKIDTLIQRLVDHGSLPAPSPSGSWPLHGHRRHGDEG